MKNILKLPQKQLNLVSRILIAIVLFTPSVEVNIFSLNKYTTLLLLGNYGKLRDV